MRLIRDITAGLYEGMPVYPGDPETRIKRVARVEDGAPANISEYCFCSHAGTHIDPPFHFDPAGARADEIPLDALIGPAVVVEADGVIDFAFIGRQDFNGVERVLFKTPGSGIMRLERDAAEALIRLGVRLVGVEGMSVEVSDDQSFPVHRALLGAGVIILEGLELSGVKPGRYELVCLPLKVRGDGAPARAVLLECV